jgi:hypothetical protein
MTATSTTTSCDCCRAKVEGAKHVLLCDGCLDARLTELESMRSRPGRRRGAGVWNGALAVGAVLHVAA